MSELANFEDESVDESANESTRPRTDERDGESDERRPAGCDRDDLRAALNRDNRVQGLTPQQVDLLARKVYNLLRYELRLEEERRGRRR